MLELLDAINQLLAATGPLVAASAAVVAGLVALSKNMGKLRRILGTSDARIVAELRLLSETRLEMINTLTSQLASSRLELADEREAHARTREERDFARMSADACDRRLQEFRDRAFLEHRP